MFHLVMLGGHRLATILQPQFIYLISSDWEILMRLPNARRALLWVLDGIIAVISTACA